MGSIFRPKMPAPVQMVAPPEPEVSEVSFEDEARDKQVAEDERKRNRNRTGRRSTILTGSQGLNEIGDDELYKKTLLGD